MGTKRTSAAMWNALEAALGRGTPTVWSLKLFFVLHYVVYNLLQSFMLG